MRRDRVEGPKGGLITLVKDDLHFSEVRTDIDVKCIAAELRLKDFTVKIFNVYIPPGKNLNKSLMDQFSVKYKTVIVGDLNAKSKMWGSDTSDERGRVLEEFLEQSSAVVINTGQPTYQHRSGSQSHLDVAIVSIVTWPRELAGLR